MKWLQCQCPRKQLALLASGVLSKKEAGEIETHLAACADCRSYFAELNTMATPLASWEKHFAQVTPDKTTQLRWAQAIKSAERPESYRSLTPQIFLLECWQQLIWPSRRIWAGLAAVWLGIILVNTNSRASAPRMTATTSSQSTDFVMAFREQEQVLAELAPRSTPQLVLPPKRFVPRPRSEGRERFSMT